MNVDVFRKGRDSIEVVLSLDAEIRDSESERVKEGAAKSSPGAPRLLADSGHAHTFDKRRALAPLYSAGMHAFLDEAIQGARRGRQSMIPTFTQH